MDERNDSSDHSSFLTQTMDKNVSAVYQLINATQNYLVGLSRYAVDFMIPYLISTNYFKNAENEKLPNASPLESFLSYLQLLDFNLDIFNRGFFAGLKSINGYARFELGSLTAAIYNTLLNMEGEDLAAFVARQAFLMDLVANAYPQAIQDIEPEYGFHFERGEHKLVAETDRFFFLPHLSHK
jgi:hypothetical protein